MILHNMLLDFKNDWENDDVERCFDEEEIQRWDATSGKLLIKNEIAKVHVLGQSVGLL